METAITPQLLGYIRVLRERGVADAQITQKLITVGWDPAVIQESLHQLATYEQTMGGSAQKPVKAPRFVWGAFFLPFFWGIAHKQRAAWFALIPLVSIIFSFRYGLRGVQIARASGKYVSEAACAKTQHLWNRVGWGLMLLTLLGGYLVTTFVLQTSA
jgi:hypothetical protein